MSLAVGEVRSHRSGTFWEFQNEPWCNSDRWENTPWVLHGLRFHFLGVGGLGRRISVGLLAGTWAPQRATES